MVVLGAPLPLWCCLIACEKVLKPGKAPWELQEKCRDSSGFGGWKLQPLFPVGGWGVRRLACKFVCRTERLF